MARREKGHRRKIPGREEWLGYEADLDVRYAHRLFFGKTIDQVQECFGGVQSIARADELLHMPRGAFRYYVRAFAKYVLSEAARGDADSASPFLNLLVNRERREPGSVAAVYDEVADAVRPGAARLTPPAPSPAVRRPPRGRGSRRDPAAR